MTTPNDDNQHLDQSAGADGSEEANEGIEEQENDQGDTTAAATAEEGAGGGELKDGDAVTEEAEPEAEKEKLPEAEHWKQQAKQYKDKNSVSKQHSSVLRKLVHKMEADGLLDRDEIAKEVGEDRKMIDAIIDHTDLPEPGEDAHMAEVQRKMDEDFLNPTTQKALTRVYGDQKKQEELARAFNFALQSDPELQEKYQNVAPDDAIYFVLDEGKANLQDYLDFQSSGGSPKALAAENRALKAEIAELRKPKPVTTQANETEEQQTTEERELPAPKSAREARVRSFMN
ncbi:hypothetical protein ELG64_09020 [Rhizobium leguminosarum]|uniref:hypothetical protein n=1 Tax=Rhizobium leguminosarum TaxID=384 RepID=UPI0010319E84|nr:hypothetical protein [Rhizobium leguminosarum]TBH23635.1 hypothetical protein ELG64_09020 [Rhizobium leguminosarum]